MMLEKTKTPQNNKKEKLEKDSLKSQIYDLEQTTILQKNEIDRLTKMVEEGKKIYKRLLEKVADDEYISMRMLDKMNNDMDRVIRERNEIRDIISGKDTNNIHSKFIQERDGEIEKKGYEKGFNAGRMSLLKLLLMIVVLGLLIARLFF